MRNDHDNGYELLTLVDDQLVDAELDPPERVRLPPAWLAETLISIAVWLAVAITMPILISQLGWSPWWYALTGIAGLSVAANLWDLGETVFLLRQHNKRVEAGEASPA